MSSSSDLTMDRCLNGFSANDVKHRVKNKRRRVSEIKKRRKYGNFPNEKYAKGSESSMQNEEIMARNEGKEERFFSLTLL